MNLVGPHDGWFLHLSLGFEASDVEGGGIAVRVARKGFDVARSRRKKDK
ncbi:MAG TPA: hypothetical protein VM075_01675 [Anaerolineae bacterium]|nr:hypothetical protein [Anaerolineae bacterium]